MKRKMKRIQPIPAIDLIDGKCVRLSKGDYAQRKQYDASPLDMALRYQDIGIRRLHLVDLDGAKLSCPANLRTLEEIAGQTHLDIEWGGGIKSSQALQDTFNAGAGRIIAGSIAVSQPELFIEWLQTYGSRKLILGADLKEGFIATHGWLQTSSLSIDELIGRFLPSGLEQIICTDIAKDGMLEGPSWSLYERLQNTYPDLELTVSGGISKMEDIRKLDEMGLPYVIIGKAIYENRITLKELEQWLQNE